MNPEDHEEKEARQRQREDFLEYCKDNELDPEEDGSMDEYKEVMAETGDAWWDNLDEDDRDGWTDNMNKDG